MEWASLSLLAAFGQALGWALKKKALNKSGVNNFTGFISYVVAGIFLAAIYSLFSRTEVIFSLVFWWSILWIVLLNVLAVWAGYRALDKSSLSTLMPFMALTALAIVPIEYLLRHVLPTHWQFFGMGLIVFGAIVIALGKAPTRGSFEVAGYFAITLICYSIASPLMGVAVSESGSGLFTAVIMHLGIAIGFIPLIFIAKEKSVIQSLRQRGELSKMVIWMILAGIVVALLENGPINIALETAKASEVFALKRTMPFFAMIIGFFLFQEKITWRHILGTILLVFGSVLTIWFR